MDKKFEEWHGIPREKIEWYPEINKEKCIGCGMCVTSCPRGVFKFDYEKKKAKVVNPTNCMVACITCSNLCPAEAISFTKGETTREKAQKIVKDFKVLSKVKEELEKKRKELKVR
jgi:NAD-dependent dihydropyrimidine dehydrogenase PreA subunit